MEGFGRICKSHRIASWQNSIMTKDKEATRKGHVVRCRKENALHHG